MAKILVIEDSAPLLDDIIEVLSLEGHTLYGARNGQEGVAFAQQYMPHLIICDIQMPKMDGYGVLDALREDPTTAAIPFVFLTARTGRPDMRLGMAQGADDYLTKPFTADELISMVRARLKRKDEVVREPNARIDNLRRNILLALPHELRTPLSAIMGFSEILRTDTPRLRQDQFVEIGEVIHESAQRLYRLVENHIVYAHLEVIASDAARITELRHHRTVHPAAVVQLHGAEKARVYNRADDLAQDVADEIVTVAIDAENLGRVVGELIDNAFKFSKPGTPVRVIAQPTQDVYTIVIEDHGRGMTPSQIDAIGAYMQFERAFYEHKGVGLGLIIAQRVVQLHGGTLTVTSDVGHFTRVEVTLPMVA